MSYANNQDPNIPDKISGGVDPKPTSNGSCSLDAQKMQTAEQLRDLIEMMQDEFHKLRQAKVNAEMKAQTLETDLVSTQQESEAQFVSLSEEMERWKRTAQEEKVRYEGSQQKVEMLERDNQNARRRRRRCDTRDHNRRWRCWRG